MLTPANKAILCSFASEKMVYQRVKKHVSAWCATKLYVPQEFTRTFGKPFKSPGGSGSSQLIIVTVTKD
jgi:hypothetical protein